VSIGHTELKSSTSTSINNFSPSLFAPSPLISTFSFNPALASILLYLTTTQAVQYLFFCAMAPPISTISVSELETSINALPSGKRRNPPVNLSDCALKELVQYKCNLGSQKKKDAAQSVICEPLVHLLRR
jgi:hypothetical protein